LRTGIALAVAASCIILAGCASGPKLADAQSDLPKLPEDRGRIYFYRASTLGLAVQPGIYLNGQRVGDCEPKGVFVRDVPPGDYEAATTTEVERKVSFTVAAAEEKFVRCRISMGVVVGHGILELMDPAKARREIENLSYTGRAEVTTVSH
jgi:hypothetical protein